MMCDYYVCDALTAYRYDFMSEEKEPLIMEDGHCFLKYDRDAEGNLIVNFDKEAERDCCVLGILQTVLKDKELQKARSKIELFNMFTAKYGDGSKQ